MADGLVGQWRAEDDLRRDGLDKTVLGPDAFAARLAGLQEEDSRRLGAAASGLGIEVDIDEAVAAGEAVARAARAAFVRLYDSGLVTESDRVVDECPRCQSVVPAADVQTVELPGEMLTVRVGLVASPTGASMEVPCPAPELLAGVVALVVPAGSEAAGARAVVPVVHREVPVVADPSATGPAFAIPAHDPVALVLARHLRLATIPALDRSGAVCAAGPLHGLARYAARRAARHLVEAEGALIGASQHVERAGRCPACSTVLVPVLGRHWFLSRAGLVDGANAALAEGRVEIRPAGQLPSGDPAATQSDHWCLTQQVWGGVPVPAVHCMDCGHVEVAVDPSTSCRRCMGEVAAAGGVLDARFVRCLWPLAAGGWPDRSPEPHGDEPHALLLVPAGGVNDVVPMVALGLRLAGHLPFDEVVVVPAGELREGEGVAPVELTTLLVDDDPVVARLALGGGLDLEACRSLLTGLSDPPPGPVPVDALTEAMDAAFDAGSPALALDLLAAAVTSGVPPADAGRLQALAGPFLGR